MKFNQYNFSKRALGRKYCTESKRIETRVVLETIRLSCFLPIPFIKAATLGMKTKETHFVSSGSHPDHSVAGTEINKKGVAGVSGWVDIYCD